MIDVPLNRYDVPDALFRSDNSFGIPLLDIEKQPDFVTAPVMPWGATKRNQRMPGIWHFYVEDYRFAALWDDPTPVLNSDCRSAVEPNFTTSEQMPFAVALFQVYRKRWIARYWQEMGLPVWVDLNVAPEWAEVNLLGVPDGWNAFFTRGYSDRLNFLELEYEIAKGKSKRSEPRFVVYGGGAAVERHCRTLGIQWIPEAMDCRKGKLTHG